MKGSLKGSIKVQEGLLSLGVVPQYQKSIPKYEEGLQNAKCRKGKNSLRDDLKSKGPFEGPC